MGNWNINIQGTGCHHNAKPDIDADLMATEFVAFLRSKGHTIEAASFTSGGKIDLLEAAKAPSAATVIVNGRQQIIAGDVLDYAGIVTLAGHRPDRLLSVTYMRAKFGAQGILAPGDDVEIVNGTIFSVSDTSNA